MNVHGYGDIAKRQGLGGLVSDVLGGSDSNSNSNSDQASASATTTAQDSDPGLLGGLGGDLNSVVGGLTSNVVGGLTSVLLPSTSGFLSPSSASPSLSLTSSSSQSSPTTSASASATSSFSTDISSGSSSLTSPLSSAPSSSLSSTSSSPNSSASSSSSQTSSSAPSSITPPPTSPSPVVQTEGDSVFTVTSSVPASSSPTSSSTSHPTSFLNNKPLEGGVFAVVGIIGLVIIVTLLTMTLRRRRRNKEIEEAVSFAPTTDHYFDEEKANNGPSRVSQSSSSSHNYGFDSESSHGSGAIRQTPLQPTYGNGDMMRGNTVRRMDTYGGGGGYGQPGVPPQGQAMPAYRSPNSGAAYAYVPPSTPGYAPGPQGHNIAYPVPPRSPAPVHDSVRSPPPVPNPAFSGAPVLPQLNLISATPQSSMRSLTDAQPSGFTPKAELPKARRSSLLHPSPTSGVGGSAARDQRSYSRELDPEQPGMPVSPMLPDAFGSSEDGHDDPYGGVVDSKKDNGPRVLKIANE